MTGKSSSAPIGLLLSGGLDSCILLGHLLEQGNRVQPFYVRSGLVWQREEFLAARRFARAAASVDLDELVTLDLPLEDLYAGHWSLTGRDIPDAQSPDDAVYLPGRNALLVIKPALWCRMHGIDRLALGVLKSNPFRDATADFFNPFQSALGLAIGGRISLIRPFENLDKRQVMQLGAEMPLELTFSCLQPVDGLHCGRCNKCAERTAAFRLIDAKDPTEYFGGRLPSVTL